jgi:hypothetical protein
LFGRCFNPAFRLLEECHHKNVISMIFADVDHFGNPKRLRFQTGRVVRPPAIGVEITG